jgi:HK97 family phage portal protein
MSWFNRNNIEKRSSATSDLGSSDSSDATGFALSFEQYREIGSPMTLSAVYAAIELITNSIAQCPIHIRDFSGNILRDHPLSSLFSHNLLSKYMMIKSLLKDMYLFGNGIAYIERKSNMPVHLIYIPHNQYTIMYNEVSRELYYQIPTVSTKKIKPQDVIHIYKNSNDGIQGKGLKTYACNSINLAKSTEATAKGYFDSGCAVNGILKSSKHLSRKQQQDIQTAWHTAKASSTTNNIAVMPVDLDYIVLSNNANDSQLLETRLYNIQEIARFFNINPVLLGDLSHSSYSTIEAAQMEFVVHTLAPLIELIQDEFNRKLCTDLEVTIDIDEDHILKADKSATASYLQTLTSSGILSINEARHQLGYEPIEGGDKHIIPYTNLDQNSVEDHATSTVSNKGKNINNNTDDRVQTDTTESKV